MAQTVNESSLPDMELNDSSRLSTPPEMEPVMDCSLVLTTLSGVTIKVSLSVAKFDRFEDLEDQVMDYLASVTNLKVFGCSIDFLQTATQTYLEDPIWDRLQQGMAYTVVFSNPAITGTTRRMPYPSCSACRSCSYEPRGNRPRRGFCRGSASATC